MSIINIVITATQPIPSNCFVAVLYSHSASAGTVGETIQIEIYFMNTDAQWFFRSSLFITGAFEESATWLSCCLSDLKCLPHMQDLLWV